MEHSGSALAEEGTEVGIVVKGITEKNAGLAHPLAACFGSVPLWIICSTYNSRTLRTSSSNPLLTRA